MKRFKIGMVLFFAVLLATTPALAGTWYIGGGINSVSLGEDLEDWADSGAGLAFNFGYNFNPGFALDFLLGSSAHEDFEGDDMVYGRFDIGAEFIMAPGPFAPYLTVGLSSHDLGYDDLPGSFEGGGLFLGGGFDYYFTPGHSLDVGLRFHSWSIDINTGGGTIITDVGDATTTVLSIMYNYHFIM